MVEFLGAMQNNKMISADEIDFKTDDPFFDKVINLIADCTGPCVICGGKPEIVGVYTPADPKKWGKKHGHRIFGYCLCEHCLNIKDLTERIEKIIQHGLKNNPSIYIL